MAVASPKKLLSRIFRVVLVVVLVVVAIVVWKLAVVVVVLTLITADQKKQTHRQSETERLADRDRQTETDRQKGRTSRQADRQNVWTVPTSAYPDPPCGGAASCLADDEARARGQFGTP